MPRAPNTIPSRTVTITTTDQVVKLLEKLVKTGLHGKNPAEAAERLLASSLREVLIRGELGKPRGPKPKRR